jgi:hypothetical protein
VFAGTDPAQSLLFITYLAPWLVGQDLLLIGNHAPDHSDSENLMTIIVIY